MDRNLRLVLRPVPWGIFFCLLALALWMIVNQPKTVPADSGGVKILATSSPSISVTQRPSPDGQPPSATPPPVEEHQSMSYVAYHAGSHIKDLSAFGGFAPSNNFPRPIIEPEAGKTEALYLLAEPDRVVSSAYMRLVLVNATSMNVALNACDSKLPIVQEAMDEDGHWKPIEYNIASDCGNSYHRVISAPHQFWEFAARRYGGPIKTRLRFRLVISENLSAYSNEFEGGVFKSQFITPANVRKWPK